jgi:predicted transcriptional regulator
VSNEINAAWAKGRAKRAKGLHGVHNEIVRALNAQNRKRAADAAGTQTINPPANPANVKEGLAHLAAGRTRH